ncbi:MAG: TadE/TadG family type IV pilus assembly protein [Sphingomonadales bacterium]
MDRPAGLARIGPVCAKTAGACRRRLSGLGRSVRAVISDRAGGVAIELAIAAPVLTMMTGGILETSTVLLVNSMMEGAAIEAAREIRTGQLQRAGDPLATFRTRLCGAMLNLVDCGKISFDVRNFSDFGTTDAVLELDKEGNPVAVQFSPGGAQAITFVRVTFRWEFLTPMIGRLLSDNGTNSMLLISTAVFQNEPYEGA